MSSRCSVPATEMSQLTEELLARLLGGGGARRIAEERDDRSQGRLLCLADPSQENLLGAEQHVGYVIRVPVDPELVTQP